MIHLSQTNAKSFDDLVFNNRNQAYGAYVLRREYPKNVLKSLLIGVAMIASILAIPFISDYFKKEAVTTASTPTSDTITFSTPPPTDPLPDPVKPKGGPKPDVNNLVFVIPEITDQVVNDTLPTSEDFDKFNPSSFNSRGNGIGGFDQGPGDGTDILIGEDDDQIHSIITIEQVPEYPGGESAMYKFLDDNIVYPEHARNIGIEGKVYVTFVVDQFGNLTNIQTPRPVGGGLDDEAMRVVKIMPRWKPGKMNGRPVKVKYNLPIVFRLH